MEKESRDEIHVLMVAFASQGHINPLLRLGKRLISKGLHVTLAITEIARHRILKSSVTTSISRVQLLFFSDGLSLDYDRKANLDHYLETLGKFGPINLSNLIKENYPKDGYKKLSCIINNPFVPWVIDVAIEHATPCAMLWIQPCSLYAIYYHFYNKLNSFPTLTNPEMSVELPGLPLLLTEDLPSFVLPSNPFGSIPKLFSDVFLNIKKYTWVLGNSFFELEKDVINSMADLYPIRPVGPLVPPSLLGEDQDEDIGVDMWKAEDSCIEWLNKQEPSSVIYVSFGSIIVLSSQQMGSILKALKNTNHPFLWVVKQLTDAPLASGNGQLPLGFLEETKDQGLVVSWSPQTKVLSHPSIACFITHCGWNSMLETIVAGVPVIACPQWTDQPTNAKLIVDVFRIGLRLRANQDGIVTNDEFEKCIKEIMNGPKSEVFESNAKALKQAAREALAGSGSSDRNIQLFVQEILERSCSCGVRI
ncbi:UDP-glycosyltransferase 84B1 [Ricinus communis]|uniref:Glycosyltransferase n=1 Tax=Ricinus communis TaxID=3988 RepID=B9RY87_RICCO|nr:UDP-glycosyltransferase 84B1 [Ricinus communis]EEF43596.1 UDP-glucosyltransferase, putative [Ricinus communis]